MTTTETFNKVLKIGVEKNNMELIQLVCVQSSPTNFDECLALATDKGHTEIIVFLMKKMASLLEVKPMGTVLAPLFRMLVISQMSMDMSEATRYTTNNSVLMQDIIHNAEKALKDLESGVVSLEEINHCNQSGWTVLHFLARNARSIPKAAEIMQKLLDLGADVNENSETLPPLFYALRNSCGDSTEDAVKILLKDPKIDINIQRSGLTALHDTLSLFPNVQSSPNSMELLLKDPRLDINIKDGSGRTILIHMLERGMRIQSHWAHLVDLVVAHKDLKCQITLRLEHLPLDLRLELVKKYESAFTTPTKN